MDSFNFQSIKVDQKANLKIKNRRLQKVTALFRLIELCVFLIILSRFSSLLPHVAFKLSGEYFRGLFLSLVSPRFVFILGNLIVIVLYFKSRQSSPQEPTITNHKIDLYDEYVESCQRNETVHIEETSHHKQKQLSMFAERAAAIADHDHTCSYIQKRIHRSHSEKLKSMRCDEQQPRHVLRRSVTERRLESVNNGDRTVATSSPHAVDDMSNEEFRYRVEAFIARQQRLIKEEEEEEFTALGAC